MTDFMASDQDVNRVIRSWLREDRHEDVSRVAGAVLDQVETIPQRRATWWPTRRTPNMSKFIGFGLAAAAGVVAAVIGFQLLGSPSVGGPGVEPSSTPEPTSSSEPTPTPTPEPMPVGLLPEGLHVLTDGSALDGMPTLPITVTISAPDWYGEPSVGILTKNDNAAAPDGAGLIVFAGELSVYGDPCQWSTTRPDTPATTVDELAAALAAQASRDASDPVDITLDGHAGKAITLHVPDDAVFGECDQGLFASWGMPGPDESPFRYHQDPGQVDEVWIVDVDGTLAVMDMAYYEGTPQEVVDELRAIVESITFTAP